MSLFHVSLVQKSGVLFRKEYGAGICIYFAYIYILSQMASSSKSRIRNWIRIRIDQKCWIQIEVRHWNQCGSTAPLLILPVFRIRRIRVFLGLLDPQPDPLLICSDPDPSINKQKYEEKSWLLLFCDFMTFFISDEKSRVLSRIRIRIR